MTEIETTPTNPWPEHMAQITEHNRVPLANIRERQGGDPLVLDLTGHGLNTTSLDGSQVHFDLNNDFFSERTGWIGAGAENDNFETQNRREVA
jgi:hypothetical protein